MAFKRKVPSTVGELKDYLDKVHKNRAHITAVNVNPANNRLEIDLDGKANFFGYPDMYIPLKAGQHEAAKEMIERMMSQSASGFTPSDSDAKRLFDMIDPTGQ